MASLNELARYIRFQLSQLRSLNKHHAFEELARQFARLCVCENILPATGPVSLEPRGVKEKAGQIGFVRALQDTAGDIRQAFVVQDNQACQVVLEMAKLASILKEVAQDVRVGGHDGHGSYDGKLHATFALSHRGWDRASEYHIDASNGKTQQSSLLVRSRGAPARHR